MPAYVRAVHPRPKRRANPLFAAAVVIAAALAPARASAQEATPPNAGAPATPLGFRAAPGWAAANERYFLAGTVEVGAFYLRPQFALGYGKPHWAWFGFDSQSAISGSLLSESAAMRLSLPFLDIRTGMRFVFPFNRSFLVPQDSYDKLDIETRDGPASRYIVYELEASANASVGPGSFIGVATLSAVRGVPAGYNVYEEGLRVVMSQGYVARARVGYALGVGDGRIRIGPVVEVLEGSRVPFIVRAGVIGSVIVNQEIEVVTSFVPVIASQDNLGLNGGDFAQLGLRYRWATSQGTPPASDLSR